MPPDISAIPRTTVRYAIERYPKEKRDELPALTKIKRRFR